MMNLSHFRSCFSLISAVCVVLATGCGNQPTHPNQFNGFDGASYDSLLLAHGALTSLRAQVAVAYPKYTPVFNDAEASYAAAFNAYSLFRTAPQGQAELAVAISNLTISIVSLEDTFQSDLKVSPEVVAEVHKKARTLKQKAAHQQITVSDILTELEIAAAIARAIPGAAPYAGIASMVISATSEALATETAQAGQPIDLINIQPIPAI